MYRSLLLAPALATTTLFFHGTAEAQQTVHQVVVLNEGRYDYAGQVQAVPVTLGSYDPASGAYQSVATIADARFGTYVLVDAGAIYVGADTLLLKYDADSYELLGQATVKGIRRFAVWNDQLICTKGDFGPIPHFVEVFDKNTLEPLYHIPAIDLPYACDGVQVAGDKAYFAVNNAFDLPNLLGMVGVLDLASETYEGGIDLGPDGRNPENIMVDGDVLYTFNNTDFTGSSVSKIGLGNGQLAYTNNVAQASSCAASALSANGRIYFLEYAVGHLARYNTAVDAVEDTLATSPNVYGIIEDPINDVMYVTTTDYVSAGDLHVMAHDGTVLNTVPVSVSPGRMALDVRTATAVQEPLGMDLRLFPNPAHEELFLRMPSAEGRRHVTILDGVGRVVVDELRAATPTQRFDVSSFARGLYTLRVDGIGAARFTVE